MESDDDQADEHKAQKKRLKGVTKKEKTSKKKKSKVKRIERSNIAEEESGIGSEDEINSERNEDEAEEADDSNALDNPDTKINIHSWTMLGVPEILAKALADQGFYAPTPIQALTLAPAILGRRDILGAAETGSGKTLAFGLPILNGILEAQKKDSENMGNMSTDSFRTDEQNSDSELDEEDRNSGL